MQVNNGIGIQYGVQDCDCWNAEVAELPSLGENYLL